MTTENTNQKYIWATWQVPASANLAAYFMDDSDNKPYIHAFVDEYEEDGEGFHLEAEGALFWVEPSVRDGAYSRFVLAVPAGAYARYDKPVFSPSELGEVEADEWGINTREEIKSEIKSLEGTD